VFVARIDGSDVGHAQDGLDGVLLVRHWARNTAMDAEDVMIDDSRERQTIEALVDLLPNTFSQLWAKASL
jgi:hypothetical protein